MEETQVFSICIALALDLVRIYIKLQGLPELELTFTQEDMTDVKSQPQIFKALCEQVVTLHNRITTETDTTELMHRLLYSSFNLPLKELETINQALHTHDLGELVNLNNLFSNLEFKPPKFLIVKKELNFEMLMAIEPKKMLRNAIPTLGMSVLSEPNMENVTLNVKGVTKYDERNQTFTALPGIEMDEYDGLVESPELTDLDLASLFLCTDRFAQFNLWKKNL